MIIPRQQERSLPPTHTPVLYILGQCAASYCSVYRFQLHFIIHRSHPRSLPVLRMRFPLVQSIDKANKGEYDWDHAHQIEEALDKLRSSQSPSANKFYVYILYDVEKLKVKHCCPSTGKKICFNGQCWFLTFLRSIFYIGKGTGDRSKQHISDVNAKVDRYREAKRLNDVSQANDEYRPENKKEAKLMSLILNDQPVGRLEYYVNSCERQALIIEACMIEALGENINLTNETKGTGYRDAVEFVGDELNVVPVALLFFLRFFQAAVEKEQGLFLNNAQILDCHLDMVNDRKE